MIYFCLFYPNSVTAKPASTTTTAPASSTKPVESKKAITISFSSLKPKPKIFVGAAFFSTGKKPTSMYKKSTPKSLTRPTSVPVKPKSAPSQITNEKAKQHPPAPVTNLLQKCPAEVRRNNVKNCVFYLCRP